MEKCREQGLPEPDFEEENGVMKVVFYKDKFTEDNLKKLGINERQIKAVMYIKEKKSINLSSFKTIVSEVSEKTLYRDLQELVNKGILKELGEKKGRKYKLL
jgi:ATP-dependent DNA helicase RecG